MIEKAILTCALTGVLTDPRQHPVPVTPAQMAAEARDAFNAGASILHVHLRRQEETTDWLAKLHGIGAATGVQLKSASYKTQKTDARIVRYEIVLPVAGSYGQIRDFLKRALAEIPVLSIDALNMKTDQGLLQAQMRLTLHMVKS